MYSADGPGKDSKKKVQETLSRVEKEVKGNSGEKNMCSDTEA